MRILGISAFYHDSAATLVVDGKIIAAAQEERFTRIKHDSSHPSNAIAYCLHEAGLEIEQIDYVAFYDKPLLKFMRLLQTYLAFAPTGFKSFKTAMPIWFKDKLFQKKLLCQELQRHAPNFDWKNKLLFSEHHQSHAASAFYPSPFENAVVLTMDGVGEWTTTSIAIGQGNKLKIIKEIHFPHSLGLLYSAFTYYAGFKVNSGEYKVMGLAPYGEPRFKDLIMEKLIHIKKDGSFRLDMSYFNYCTGLTMTNNKFAQLFGRPARKPEDDDLEQIHMDIAASIQAVIEEVILRLTRDLAQKHGIDSLCLAGGVALNCVSNGKILRDGAFKNIWIQPAAGDAGGSLGAALTVNHHYLGRARNVDGFKDLMDGSFLGPEFKQHEIERRLTESGAVFEVLNEETLLSQTVEALTNEKAIGWMQGRMEFGPRALGGRSIIADPRSSEMQKVLNLKVKYRESFRPFAPSVLSEDASNWFNLEGDSPYMLIVADVVQSKQRKMSKSEEKLFGIEKLNVPRSEIPAVTHVDYSARIQTVHKETNQLYHSLIRAFKERTGCPVVVNTSFNVRGEPIVHTPEDAFRCFMGTELDVLVIGNCFLKKGDQDQKLKLDYKDQFELD